MLARGGSNGFGFPHRILVDFDSSRMIGNPTKSYTSFYGAPEDLTSTYPILLVEMSMDIWIIGCLIYEIGAERQLFETTEYLEYCTKAVASALNPSEFYAFLASLYRQITPQKSPQRPRVRKSATS